MKSVLCLGFVALFTSGCATAVSHRMNMAVQSDSPPISVNDVRVFNSANEVTNPFDVSANVSVSDTGFSVACGYEAFIKSIQTKAVQLKADAAVVTSVDSPDFMSTCYRGSAALIVYRKEPENVVAQLSSEDDARYQKLSKACKAKSAKACVEAGLIQVKANDIKNAAALFEAGCDLKDGTACQNAGIAAIQSGSSVYGKRLLTEACEMGTRKACKMLDQLADYEQQQETARANQDRAIRIQQENARINAFNEMNARERSRDMQQSIQSIQKAFAPAPTPKRTNCVTHGTGNYIYTDCQEN